MKINIIGSGWLAQPLAQQLTADGHQLLLTTTQDEKLRSLEAKGLPALQYQLGEQLSEPEQLFDTDVLITAITSKDVKAFDVLMDQLNQQQCKHLIYISSTSVYQNNQLTHKETSQSINQDSPIRSIEKLIQTHHSSTIIRFAGLVGPGRNPGRFFTHGRTLKNPSAPVNLIHLDDCTGIIKAVIDRGAKNEIFNGCADTHPSKLEFYGCMAKSLNLPIPQFEECSTGSFKIIDNQKVKAELCYQFIHHDVMNMTY